MDVQKTLSSSSHAYGRHQSRGPSSNHPNLAFSTPRCRFPNTKLRRPTLDHYLKCSSVPAGNYKPRRLVIAASPDHVHAHDSSQDEKAIIPRSRGNNNKSPPHGVFCEFFVPYAQIGYIIFCISRAGRVFVGINSSSPLLLLPVLQDLSVVVKLVSGLVSIVCYNIFVGGINQIYDIEIDKINKPLRPLPSGDMSVRTAWALTISSLVLGLAIVIANKAEPCVVFLYSLALFVGGAYSVPPIRFKRFPIFASIIMGVGHIFSNFGVYRALKATFPTFAIQWTPALSFITVFSVVVYFVLGIIKDIPDIEGDRKHQIFTVAVALGPRNTAFVGSGIVLLLYVVAIGLSILMTHSFNTVVMIPSHIIMALLLIYRLWVLHKTEYAQKECQQFYMFVWTLVSLENFIFPFI